MGSTADPSHPQLVRVHGIRAGRAPLTVMAIRRIPGPAGHGRGRASDPELRARGPRERPPRGFRGGRRSGPAGDGARRRPRDGAGDRAGRRSHGAAPAHSARGIREVEGPGAPAARVRPGRHGARARGDVRDSEGHQRVGTILDWRRTEAKVHVLDDLRGDHVRKIEYAAVQGVRPTPEAVTTPRGTARGPHRRQLAVARPSRAAPGHSPPGGPGATRGGSRRRRRPGS